MNNDQALAILVSRHKRALGLDTYLAALRQKLEHDVEWQYSKTVYVEIDSNCWLGAISWDDFCELVSRLRGGSAEFAQVAYEAAMTEWLKQLGFTIVSFSVNPSAVELLPAGDSREIPDQYVILKSKLRFSPVG